MKELIDNVMEQVCDKCYSVDTLTEKELKEVCEACTIRPSIESLVRRARVNATKSVVTKVMEVIGETIPGVMNK